MKRLCGAGYEKIVSIGKCWRAEEEGPHHEPEFTMVEWYRAHAPLERLADDCEILCRLARAAARGAVPMASEVTSADGTPPLASPPHEESRARHSGAAQAEDSPGSEFEFRRTTVRALFAEHLGVELRGDEPVHALLALAERVGVTVGGAEGRVIAWDDVFFQIWLDRIEPRLAAAPGATFVFDWPLPLAALARPRPSDPRVAERFELYAGGLELANAFGELTDPVLQRQRFVEESARRASLGKVTYPLDEALLAALATMPPTAGIALGFDRLVLWALGGGALRDVMAFAADEV
jgi:lysyl-tRNA synthetase class 2